MADRDSGDEYSIQDDSSTRLGLSYNEIVETLAMFLEVSIHTLLCVRSVYPPTTFTRRRAHGVPVYQSRHPAVRDYVSEVVASLVPLLENGRAQRVTLVVRDTGVGHVLERFIFDFGFLDVEALGGAGRDAKIQGAPTASELSLKLRGFLIKLADLDGKLTDLEQEVTWAVVVETRDDLEPARPGDGTESPWIPALAADTLNTSSAIEGHHEPLLSVRAVETGVIDLRLMVQECVAKTGVEHLQP